MPGVPSGRACDNCRRRRQKCDYLKPTCSRCARLGAECVGSGQRRFLFIDRKCARRQNIGQIFDQSAAPTPTSSLISLSPCPSNEGDTLASSFLSMIGPSTDRRFNLVWTYGAFLQNVPQRLGHNTALDVAAQALVASHRDFSLRRPVTADSLVKYSDAIRALTRSINDPATSHSLETVCAVLLLTMCQNLSGLGLEHLTSHCQGAVQMLRIRQKYHMVDEFEMDLHTYLHGPVLVQSLFNSSMRLSPLKFKELSQVLFANKDAPGASTLALLFHIPDLLQRGRMVVQGFADRDTFLAELSAIYEGLQKAKLFVHDKFMTGPSTETKYTGPYGFCLAFSCIFNCMMRGVEPDNEKLLSEADGLVKDTFDLAPEAQKNRPLGAAHMMLNFSAAWLCARFEGERQMLYLMLEDFSWDFRRDAHSMWPLEDLEAMQCDLQYRTNPKVVLAHAT
ncbi:hypothetical protein PWT90_05473 [Aphanocladium album]|nr:hypothetical protein PWT90_05473 [Aphanocladium album]